MVDRASPYFRLFAPLALGLFAVVFVVIVLSTVAAPRSEQASDSGSAGSSGQSSEKSTKRRSRSKRPTSATYRVKEGDTLAAIASKTGRSPARLEDYNPGLDAQTLQPGQKLKLRE